MSQYLGDISAYALAVSQGYTGTEEEYAELMASYATVGQTAVAAAQTATTKASEAATSATTATNKATEATTAATTATTKAGEASTSASTATSAKDTAVSASQTATTKATEATTAAATATSAATTATTAKDDAVSAKTAAQTAQAGAETAAASVQASASQIAQNTSDISELKEDFAIMESDGVVPSAEQILTDKGVTDSVPYHYRKTGGDGADRLYDQIVGGTVCFNQQIIGTDSATDWVAWKMSLASSDGAIVATAQEDNINAMSVRPNAVNVIQGHKYLLDAYLMASEATTMTVFTINETGFTNWISLVANTWTRVQVVNSAYATSTTFRLFPDQAGGHTAGFALKIKNYMLFDLTAMFGAEIADYIYSLEQANTGAGVAFFKALFPNDYYPYNSGELVSVSGLSAHVMRDVDNNIIRSYPLDSTLTLRGLFKLDANNNLYADGDTYDADGTVTRKYGIVDLGSLTWTHDTSLKRFYAGISTSAKPASSAVINAISSIYYAVSMDTFGGSTSLDHVMAMSSGGNLSVRNLDLDNGTASAFKTAMSGVMLVYELAEPTTEEEEPYQHLQQCDPNGTEEYVSTGIVPIGHNSFYPENLRAKVEQLPWNFANLIAPTESTFTATRNYTTGALFIVDNVLYKATSNIANGGTITPNTNCTATTLAEIISALA